ncbi:hypothetical protein BV25DRAFT_1765332, partial [Artomyces pyxidatus]
IRSKVTNDLLGNLPCFPGMKVMVTENLAMQHGIVNGSEGVVSHVDSGTDDDGQTYAKCVYVRVPGCGIKLSGLEADVVPIYPVRKSCEYKKKNTNVHARFSRMQVPLLPAYAYTDYKSQGRSLERAVVDIA